jgi:hypothetical protein
LESTNFFQACSSLSLDLSIQRRSRAARVVPKAIQKKSGIVVAWGDPRNPPRGSGGLIRAKGPISARIVLNRGFDFKGFVLRHHYESGAKHRPFRYSVWFYLDLKGNTRIPTRAGSAGGCASEPCQQGNRLQSQCVGAHSKVPRIIPPCKVWRDEPNNVEPGSVPLNCFGRWPHHF